MRRSLLVLALLTVTAPVAGAQYINQLPGKRGASVPAMPGTEGMTLPPGTPMPKPAAQAAPASPVAPPKPRTGPGVVMVELLEGPIKIVGPGQEAGSPAVRNAMIQLEDTLGVRTFGHARTDSLGQVKFSVAAGAYKIHVMTCPGAYSLPPKIPTTVRPGGGGAVRIGCNIRPRKS